MNFMLGSTEFSACGTATEAYATSAAIISASQGNGPLHAVPIMLLGLATCQGTAIKRKEVAVLIADA